MMKSILTKGISLGLVFMLLIMGALVGCSANSGGSSKDSGEGKWAGQKITVQLIGDFTMESSTDPITGETTKGVSVLKKEFEKRHPGATVEFVLMPWEGYVEKTQAMISSGEADVYQMPGVADFAAQGVLEPLKPYIKKDNFNLDKYINSQVEGWKALGPDDDNLKIYGLPVLGDTRFIAFDKKLFDQWGVEYLSKNPTMEEIMTKAKKMTGTNPVTGEKNYGAWFRGDWSSAFTLVNLAEGQGGQWGSGFDWDDVEINFDSPEMVKGLKWLLELKQYTPKGIVSNQGNEKWMTKENNIAIMLNQDPGDNIKPAFAAGIEDRIQIVDEFSNSEGVGGLFAGSPFTIAKDSKHKDLAWEFIKFSSSEFYQKFNWEEYGLLPVTQSALEWESITSNHLAQRALEILATPWTPRYPWGSSQPRFILTSKIESALTDDLTAEEALKQAQKESQDWVDNNN